MTVTTACLYYLQPRYNSLQIISTKNAMKHIQLSIDDLAIQTSVRYVRKMHTQKKNRELLYCGLKL